MSKMQEKLIEAEARLMAATERCLPENPDQQDVKRVLLSFFHDFATWIGLWLADLETRAVTTEGTLIIQTVNQRRHDLRLETKLEQVCRLALSEHGRKSAHAKNAHTDHASIISENMQRSTAFGFATMFLLNANSRRFGIWTVRHLRTQKDNETDYFKEHCVHHPEFRAGLLSAFVAETSHMDPDKVCTEIDLAFLAVKGFTRHIFLAYKE